MNTEENRRDREKGFTLIEMAVVLAVIGLILGAVSIGKDVQRDAEYTKVKQKFVDGWAQAYNAYYQRTGVVVGDLQTSPRIMIAGQDYAAAGAAVTSGGDMSAIASPGALCQGAVPTLSPTITAAATDGATMHNFFDRVGVRMPPGRAEGQEDRYVYLDSNGNPQEARICFIWQQPGTASGSGNVMIISGLTPDLARSLDQMVDGKPDAQEGVFRQYNVANGTAGQAGIIWVGDNTRSFGAAAGAAGLNQDENQVEILTAVYKMNQ